MIGLFPVIGIPPLSLCNVFAEHPGKLLGMCASQWTSSELLETGSELALQNQKNLVSSRLLLPMLQKNKPVKYYWVFVTASCCGKQQLLQLSTHVFLNALASHFPFSFSWLTFSKSASDRFLLACATHFNASVCKERKWEKVTFPDSPLSAILCSIPRTCLRSKKECSFCYKAMSVLLPCRKRTAAKKESLQNSCRTQHEISFMAAKNSSFARFENTSCRSYQVAG